MSGGTFEAGEAVELAVVERSGFVESRHIGSAVVVGPDGAVLRMLGDPSAPVFPRSCLKPFQALTVLEAIAGHAGSTTLATDATPATSVDLDAVQTVLATASHAGTARHVEVVDSILTKGGLGREDLKCPADWPGDSDARNELVRERAGRASVYMNCSGKHAAMLYACRLNGWPTETYLELDHPLQQRIAQTVERLTGEPITATGIDGCGAPIHAVSLIGLARGIGRITAATEGPAATLTASVLANGWAIDGPGRANTLVIDELHVLAKLGAEGVMVMSVTSQTAPAQHPASSETAASAGTTVALKMLDGNLRAASLVGLTLLVSVGALTQAQLDALLPHLDLTVYGGTAPVGAIRVSPNV
ncbi:asparaginase [Subtercola endophyticus]|uniref:asparaginase n=1 Tax=Subtercola endophyticus TaxID=2895559 RepID=UPI001E591590|nr:asparaginase [Subtercola endophyticus]UFS60066.1 asparaginase [Subtercola endophyticus]